jgi:shikimate kinase
MTRNSCQLSVVSKTKAQGVRRKEKPASCYTLFVTTAIILVGFMGAGKTTVGRLLARRLRWRFVDLDDRICDSERRSVPEIFRDSGEEHFRRVESECLREVLENPGSSTRTRHANPNTGDSLPAASSLGMTPSAGLVLALGGGAFVQPQNAELIRQSKVPVVFLDAAPDTLFRRCAPQIGDDTPSRAETARAGDPVNERPLLADENQFRQLYESRREGYMAAGVRVDTTALTPGQVADEIAFRVDLADYS